MREEIDSDGVIRYYNELGQLHRDDGPAVEYPRGVNLRWYQNGVNHLIGGVRYWYQNGIKHRLDGPACEWGNGDKKYWINGKQYSEDEYRLIIFTQYGKTV